MTHLHDVYKICKKCVIFLQFFPPDTQLPSLEVAELWHPEATFYTHTHTHTLIMHMHTPVVMHPSMQIQYRLQLWITCSTRIVAIIGGASCSPFIVFHESCSNEQYSTNWHQLVSDAWIITHTIILCVIKKRKKMPLIKLSHSIVCKTHSNF